MTTTTLPPHYAPDFIIVGWTPPFPPPGPPVGGGLDADMYSGGTAGCVVAARLASYLPDHAVLLIEAGPSDLNDERVLQLREWLALLGGELDYDYPITPQPMGLSCHPSPQLPLLSRLPPTRPSSCLLLALPD